MSADPLILPVAADADAGAVEAWAPWRWWWLFIIAASLMGWATIIFAVGILYDLLF